MALFGLFWRVADTCGEPSRLNVIVIKDALLWNVSEERQEEMVCAVQNGKIQIPDR